MIYLYFDSNDLFVSYAFSHTLASLSITYESYIKLKMLTWTKVRDVAVLFTKFGPFLILHDSWIWHDGLPFHWWFLMSKEKIILISSYKITTKIFQTNLFMLSLQICDCEILAVKIWLSSWYGTCGKSDTVTEKVGHLDVFSYIVLKKC